MKAILALTVALAATAVFARTHAGHKHAAPVVPTFPLDWTANEVDYMVVYQGQYEVQNGAYCCGDASCEVQTQFQSGMDYYDYTHNRTRFNDPVNGDIVSLYYPTYKEMAVDATNTCQEYCPIEDDIEPYGLDPNSTYMGQKTINGKLYADWQYKDVEFGIVFETDDVYVNSNNLPYQEVDLLTPFGEAMGVSTSTYNTFTAGTPSASLFDIKNVDNCPESQNCGSDQRQFVRRRWKLRQTWMKYYQAANLAKAEAIMRAMKH